MSRPPLTFRQLQRLGRGGTQPPIPMQAHPWVLPRHPAAQTPTQASPGLLQVLPLRIPNADSITPEGYDGAVNIALRETLPEGVLADVYYSSPRILDTVEVFWGDQDVPVASQIFDQVPTLPVRLFIPTDRIEEGEFLASCQVTAVGQSAERSATRKYLVKLSRPGGNDTDADEPGNQNMARARLPQPIIDNGVGPGDAAAGVPVTIAAWDNMALHDICELHWGSETLTQRVENTAEIGRDMVFQVGADTIRDAWDDVNLNVTYKLVDRVNNSSRDSEERPWAPTTYVEVYANDSTLYEPYVLEAGDDQEVLDLDALAGSPVSVEVDIERNSPYVSGTCTLIWRGITADGTAVVHTEDLRVSRAPMALYFEVPSAVVEQIRGGRVVVYYTLSKDGNSDHSARNSLDVIGQPLAWPAPEALDLNGDEELPIDIPFARFSTPVYGSKSAGDIIVLHVSGTSLDGQVVNYESPTYTVIEGEQDQPLVIAVPGDQLASLDGTQATVFYKVNPTTAQERISDYLTVNVGAGSSQLRAPTVLQAVEGWFNPAEYPGGATLSVPRGTLQQGDKVSYYWRGSVTPVYTSWTNAGASGPVLFEISPDLITPNLNGTVTAWYTVERGGSVVGTSPELLLNIGAQQVQWPVPGIIDATGEPANPFNPIKPGTEDEENTATLIVVDSRLKVDDIIAVVWRLPNEQDLTVPWERVSTNGEARIQVPAEALTASIGLMVMVSYVVFRMGQPVGSSDVLMLQVLDRVPLPAPAIVSAKDTQNSDIPHGGVTVATRVILAGTAAANREVEVFDGEASQGVALGDNLGSWSLAIAGLSEGTHSFTAQGLYGANPQSPPRSLTVTAEVTPTIASVSDPQGNQIANGGTTLAITVTLAGNASASQQVEVFDGATHCGTASVSVSGDWSLAVVGLSLGAHSFTVRGLYGANPESTPRLLTVTAQVTPTITSARDPQGTAVGHGGSTVATTVTLAGKANASLQVEIFDGAVGKGTAPVNGSGDWSLAVGGLVPGAHSFTAKARYGAEPSSAVYAINIVSALAWDTTAINLSGTMFVTAAGNGPSTPPASTSVSRPASGGVVPYHYVSANPAVATISSAGLIQARSNGSTTMTATDSSGQSKQLSVTVSGVVRINQTTGQWYPPANAGNILSLEIMRRVWAQCRDHGGVAALGIADGVYWTGTSAGGLNRYYTINLSSGAEGAEFGGGIGSASHNILKLA